MTALLLPYICRCRIHRQISVKKTYTEDFYTRDLCLRALAQTRHAQRVCAEMRNKMYQVLLADDEPSVLESMKEHIDWEQYGTQVAYTALTGKQAYDILTTSTPDIAILDIRMPGYSGLELSRIISQNKLKTQVIIVSGYAEFSYAQKAIQYGVLGYCLKPVEYDEITSLLLKAVRNLQKQTHANSSDDFLEAIENDDVDKITAFLKKQQYEYDVYYPLASISEHPLSIPNTLIFRIGPSQYGYLAATPVDSSMLRNLSEQESVHGIGYQDTPITPAQLRTALYRCLAMAYQFFIDADCRLCCHYHDFASLPFMSRLQNALDFGDKPRICDLLYALMKEDSRGNFSIHAAQQLYNMIISNHKIIENSQDYYIYNYKQLVHEYDSFQDMIKSLIQIVESSCEQNPGQPDLSNSYFLKIMKYINSCYTENITLKDVANVVNLNPNYISQVFKKTTGTTFSHYLTNLRIDTAKKLLTTTNSSINDVSIQAGFNDYFYFLKTFKKYTGKTPSEFRNEV